MAGPFGFEKEKYTISTALANRVLMPAVESAEKETVIVTNGFSCREQIRSYPIAAPSISPRSSPNRLISSLVTWFNIGSPAI